MNRDELENIINDILESKDRKRKEVNETLITVHKNALNIERVKEQNLLKRDRCIQMGLNFEFLIFENGKLT
jgi:hypothetical protein